MLLEHMCPARALNLKLQTPKLNPYSLQGAARIGFTAFPYSVYAFGMKDAEVITV
jgi:hypothetical protein